MSDNPLETLQQVAEVEFKLGLAEAAAAAAAAANEEAARQSSSELAALRASHAAQLQEAQQAIQRAKAEIQATYEVRHADRHSAWRLTCSSMFAPPYAADWIW